MSIGTLESARQAHQLAFTAGSADLSLGSATGLPWSVAALSGQDAGASRLPIVERFDSGLTAEVFRLRAPDGSDWTLKRARTRPGVHNVDGQTSFLNEVQRRIELAALKRDATDPERWTALVDTRYASFRQGVILSPWIEGRSIAGGAATDWNERQLTQVLFAACALWTEGFFEWDLCSGNILDDGRQIRLFDFGYQYRFEPLRHFNSAGTGTDQPMFHPAERFETHTHSGHLLKLAQAQGEQAALAAFRREKTIALEAYRWMRATIGRRGANDTVLGWLDALLEDWSAELRGSAEALYLAEQWRSHVLDLDDDLRGRSCTPLTLQRADWLLHTLTHHADALRHRGALFWGDEHRARDALLADYAGKRQLAMQYQHPLEEIP